MSARFSIPSSDPLLLEKALRVAGEFTRPYMREEIVGIVFLGAIVRGYFDASADIDIALFKDRAAAIPLPQYLKVEGLEIHCHLADFEDESSQPWDMAKRWTYSQGQIVYDPQGRIARLLAEKVPLKPEEKKWLLMSGLCLSEWYINRLTRLWVERGSLTSAHHMFARGLDYFFEMLFAFNGQLVADAKWRLYCVERLDRLPANFPERVQEVLMLRDFSVQELDRRREAFMVLWQEMLPLVVGEVGLSYAEINQLV